MVDEALPAGLNDHDQITWLVGRVAQASATAELAIGAILNNRLFAVPGAQVLAWGMPIQQALDALDAVAASAGESWPIADRVREAVKTGRDLVPQRNQVVHGTWAAERSTDISDGITLSLIRRYGKAAGRDRVRPDDVAVLLGKLGTWVEELIALTNYGQPGWSLD